MDKACSIKIDVFTHIIPSKFREAMLKASSRSAPGRDINPALHDLELRLRVIDKFDGLKQVLTIGMTDGMPDDIEDPQVRLDLARLANDELAELVAKYPDRFPAAVATLPMTDIDMSLKELERAIEDLKFRGAQILTPIKDKPLDSEEFIPFYARMAQYNLPIWIHPSRGDNYADYRTEKKSLYRIGSTFGWPYETTAAMARLVFSGILEKYPNIKFITHHAGGMLPFYATRMTQFQDTDEMRRRGKSKQYLSRQPVEYFKMYYADTALNGNAPALMLAHSFFGPDHLLFGSDTPYDNENGERGIRDTIRAIEQMDVSDLDKRKIYENNARSLLRLPI